jgi:hypothetical protein
VVRFSALRAGRSLPPRKIPGTRFYLRLSRLQGHSAAGMGRAIEKSSDLKEIQTLDLPGCNIVPRPTALPRARIILYVVRELLYTSFILTYLLTYLLTHGAEPF